MSESSVKSIKKSYLETRRKRNSDNEDIVLLPTKKRGHTLLLGNDLDEKLQLYLKQIRANGGPLTGRIAIAAARGLLLADNPSKLNLWKMVGTLNLKEIGRIHSTKEWDLFNKSQPLLKGSIRFREFSFT